MNDIDSQKISSVFFSKENGILGALFAVKIFIVSNFGKHPNVIHVLVFVCLFYIILLQSNLFNHKNKTSKIILFSLIAFEAITILLEVSLSFEKLYSNVNVSSSRLLVARLPLRLFLPYILFPVFLFQYITYAPSRNKEISVFYRLLSTLIFIVPFIFITLKFSTSTVSSIFYLGSVLLLSLSLQLQYIIPKPSRMTSFSLAFLPFLLLLVLFFSRAQHVAKNTVFLLAASTVVTALVSILCCKGKQKYLQLIAVFIHAIPIGYAYVYQVRTWQSFEKATYVFVTVSLLIFIIKTKLWQVKVLCLLILPFMLLHAGICQQKYIQSVVVLPGNRNLFDLLHLGEMSTIRIKEKEKSIICQANKTGILLWRVKYTHDFVQLYAKNSTTLFIRTTRELFSVDKQTGRINWRIGQLHQQVKVRRQVEGCLRDLFVYANNRLYAIRQKNGKLIWSTMLRRKDFWDRYLCSLSLLLRRRRRGVVEAFNTKDGTLRWRQQIKGEAFVVSYLSSSLDSLYLYSEKQGGITNIDPKTGLVRWFYSEKRLKRVEWLQMHNDVFLGFRNQSLIAFNNKKMRVIWSTKLEEKEEPVSIHLHRIRLSSKKTPKELLLFTSKRLLSIDKETGHILWEKRPRHGRGRKIVQNSRRKVIYAEYDDTLFFIEKSTGRVLWKQSLFSDPVWMLNVSSPSKTILYTVDGFFVEVNHVKRGE